MMTFWNIWNALNSTPAVIAFYTFVILVIYLKREMFEIQKLGKVPLAALRKTQTGIGLMKRVSERHGRFIRGAARVMVVPAFILMIFITGFLFYNCYNLFMEPGAAGGVEPILPGVKLPGATIVLPLWYGILGIFIVATVHEFSHGIVATAHKLKIKSTGFFLFGPILGAFVEPDEKQLRKAPHKVQNAIYAAGPIGNMLFAILVFCLMLGTTWAWASAAQPFVIGLNFNEVAEGFPAADAGLPANVTFTHANGERVYFTSEFSKVMDGLKPGDSLVMTSESGSEYTIIAGEHPEKGPEFAYVGVSGMSSQFRKMGTLYDIGFSFLAWLYDLFMWIMILSIGIGLMNLFPIGPADGGRMLQLVLHKLRGKEQGNKLWKQATLFSLIVLMINIFIPMGRAVFNSVLSLF